MLKVQFNDLVSNFKSEAEHPLSKHTIESYNQILETYKAVITQIPSAPPPFPPTKLTIGVFLKYKKDLGISYSALKTYLVALSHYCRTNGIQDETKDPSIKKFMAAANKTMLGSSFPYDVDAIKPEDLDLIATKINRNNFIEIRDMALFSHNLNAC